MITSEEAARLLTAEAEQTIALLGGRLVGGALRVAELRLAVGQTGEVAEDESFLLSPATDGRPGWAVEVRVVADQDAEPVAPPPPLPPTTPAAAPLAAVADRSCTVLRGVDAETARALARVGVTDVGSLALHPESRMDDLVRPATGLRLVDAWSRAQLLRLPLPRVDLAPLAAVPLADLVGATPQRLRGLGLATSVPDHEVEALTRSLTLVGAALDVRVLRTLRLGDLDDRRAEDGR